MKKNGFSLEGLISVFEKLQNNERLKKNRSFQISSERLGAESIPRAPTLRKMKTLQPLYGAQIHRFVFNNQYSMVLHGGSGSINVLK